MLHKTRGIVLKNTSYGETSCIVTMLTELFGIQSYIINNIRTHSKTGNKAAYFQPSCILDLVVYNNKLKNVQRIKDFKFFYLYTNITNNIYKNAVALYMIELLQKCLKQPESNTDLYCKVEESFIQLDKANVMQTANYSLYYTLLLTSLLGFELHGSYSNNTNIIDLVEGTFVKDIPIHGNYIDKELSNKTHALQQLKSIQDIEKIQLSQPQRRQLLTAYEIFLKYHIADFTSLKSLPVLYTLFE